MRLLNYLFLTFCNLFASPSVESAPVEVAPRRLRLKHADGDWIEQPDSDIKIDTELNVFVKVSGRWSPAPGIVEIEYKSDVKPEQQ